MGAVGVIGPDGEPRGIVKGRVPDVNAGASKVHKINEPERWEKDETWGMTCAILNLILYE